MRSELAIKLQAQCDKPGVANPHGYPCWYLGKGDELKPAESPKRDGTWHHVVSPRYPTPTWQQLVRSVKKRYRVKW
jgi:hypothetical protein